MKNLLINVTLLFLAALALFSCTVKQEFEQEGVTILNVSLRDGSGRTVMGQSVGEQRKVYWCDGDCLSLDGTASNPLSGVGESASSAVFTFPGVHTAPFNLLYPASFWKNASTITLPAEQEYASGSFASNSAPLAAHVTSVSGSILLGHLCTVLQLSVSKDAGVSASSLSTVRFYGNADEQVCGDFSIDYTVPSLSPAAESEEGRELVLSVAQPLDSETPLELYLVVPAGEYASGFSVVLEDNQHRTMTKVKNGAVTLSAGSLKKMTAFTFVPSSIATEFEIADIIEDYIEPDAGEYNLTGRVVDNAGKGLQGVVVSDGLRCVQTMPDGKFFMQSSLASVKFVYVSSPSGYMPAVSGGIPRFYKLLSEVTPSAGVYDMGDYVMTPVANPDRFTLLITADPQPRKFNWTLDRIAYKSLDVCQDLYQELYDVASGISGRQVYGICLGDIVHEDMSLYSNYVTALGTLGYPTYNIIGNHDNDYDVSSDDEAAEPYESYFGPRNYSFNIGGIHFVMLDNLIQGGYNNDKTYDAFDQGLTDAIWTWLQNDMAFVPTNTKIMVCAHSPMFKYQSGSERTNTAYHGGTTSKKNGGAYGYGDLFDKYGEVHAWAGHTHSGFNFVYSNSHRHKNIQVHTLARSTGELWTNEYLANGTPRGFTVVEVDNGSITWKFHPMTRQRGAFQGVTTGYCSAGAPAYAWRDWSYNASSVAVMNGGGALTEDYQMHAYPRGAYGDDYVYVNVFLWDEKWEIPVWTPTGGTPVQMTRIYSPGNALIEDTEKIYDKADTEFRSWYKTYANKSGGSLAALEGYYTVAPESDGLITTLFRAPADASPASGTVSVTDRFGNVYTRTVSW